METKRKYKRYSREFKLEAVKRSNDPTKTIAQVARELDITEKNLPAWRHQMTQKGHDSCPGNGRTTPAADNNELMRLRKEVVRLREERDILKKSLIFFARDDKKDSDL